MYYVPSVPGSWNMNENKIEFLKIPVLERLYSSGSEKNKINMQIIEHIDK